MPRSRKKTQAPAKASIRCSPIKANIRCRSVETAAFEKVDLLPLNRPNSAHEQSAGVDNKATSLRDPSTCHRNRSTRIRKQRTSFLTLPHELRQQIILGTFDATKALPILNDVHIIKRARELAAWARSLIAVHTDIVGDVRFVLDKWIDIVAAMIEKQGKATQRMRDQLSELEAKIRVEASADRINETVDQHNRVRTALNWVLGFDRSYADVLKSGMNKLKRPTLDIVLASLG